MALVAATVVLTLRIASKPRPFYLTPHGSQQVWGIARRADGSEVTQLGVTIMAKNLSTTPLRPLAARLVQPRIKGDVLINTVDVYITGPEFEVNTVPPSATYPLRVSLMIGGTPKQKSGRLMATFAIADDQGREQEVSVSLQGAA